MRRLILQHLMQGVCVMGLALPAVPAAGQSASERPLTRAPERALEAAASVDPSTPLAARTKKVPAGAVRLAAAPARAPRSGVVRVPLAAEPGAENAKPDVFGIAAGAGRIDTSRAEAPVLEVPANGVTIVTSQRGRENVEREELTVEQKTSLPWLVVETQRTPSAPAMRTARPFLTLARAISWDASLTRHVAEFLFGLDAEDGQPGPLHEAVDVRFGVSCEDVTPTRAQITSIIGLLVTLAVLLVPQLASLPARALGTELGSFVVAALAGFGGVPLVEKLATTIFPALSPAPRGKRDDANAA